MLYSVFLLALRSILRSDPDVVLIGEIDERGLATGLEGDGVGIEIVGEDDVKAAAGAA